MEARKRCPGGMPSGRPFKPEHGIADRRHAGSPYPNGLWRESVQRICKIVRYSVELRSI
ncbi:MAG: hypothetical protein CBCREVIR_3208 [Candidatus Burkholderia crenata]|nr:MAG: hypothetical protein CBCREVIR_3208 [Candidatus Burkholderia crenata]